jgi:hypothetical protein
LFAHDGEVEGESNKISVFGLGQLCF